MQIGISCEDACDRFDSMVKVGWLEAMHPYSRNQPRILIGFSVPASGTHFLFKDGRETNRNRFPRTRNAEDYRLAHGERLAWIPRVLSAPDEIRQPHWLYARHYYISKTRDEERFIVVLNGSPAAMTFVTAYPLRDLREYEKLLRESRVAMVHKVKGPPKRPKY